MDASQPVITASAAKLHLSPTLEINELVHRVRASGKKVIHLGFGEATFPIQEEVLQCHREACNLTSYLPVAGLGELRERIAAYQSGRLNIPIQADQVVVAPGSKPLLFALFDILEGDVLLPRPSWVSYEPQVAHAGKQLFWIETDEHDRHTLTEKALDSAYTSAVDAGARPRIMLINSPSNPTGQVFSKEQISLIVKFCRERSITLISDEIYSDICFNAEDVQISAFGSAFGEDGTVIMTGGLSKTYSAGGWRVGYAIFPSSPVGKAIRRTTLAYASECWSAASAPSQMASIKAFSSSRATSEPIGPAMDTYREAVNCLHRMCTTRLYHALKNCGIAVAEPKGSFYLYPSFQPYASQLQKIGVLTSPDLSKWLIKECGLAALPGSAFGEKDERQCVSGGNLRLRMATSYLYFSSEEEKYSKGYALLKSAAAGEEVSLPLLEEAIAAIQAAIKKLKAQ
ncbi:plp-dependent transferase [Penicillium lagena]|uniref:plp-dependent transferase n=1 Tax=Penicillium lagena TaxID=94218 RepID=UPI00254258EA|nr:plp-dependent transferase [Penicillium lagena]KAJ5624268.1 plp-dependent transferase [Penicillium lagena]